MEDTETKGTGRETKYDHINRNHERPLQTSTPETHVFPSLNLLEFPRKKMFSSIRSSSKENRLYVFV